MDTVGSQLTTVSASTATVSTFPLFLEKTGRLFFQEVEVKEEEVVNYGNRDQEKQTLLFDLALGSRSLVVRRFYKV